MRIFDFDPAAHRPEYESQGWVHIPQGVTLKFHAYLLDYVERELRAHVLEGFAIKGKKEQSLFEFPADVDYPGEPFDVIAELCGLNRPTMTLSERHIQAYEANANPEPPAHKDRFPSQVSVGLSVTIPAESQLVLYPYDHREINPFNTSAGYRQSLQPDELPEVALPSAREVELDDRDRDVVVFPGSTTWHLRRRSARSVNLYMKFNDFECDPLGEDPRTDDRRAWALGAVQSHSGSELDALVPLVSRRFDAVSRFYTRHDWQEVLQAQIFGEAPFGITQAQFELLSAADGQRSIGELALTANGGGAERAREEIVRLVERGVLDLIPADAPRPPERASAPGGTP